jgi:hypothetical protein
VRSEERRDAGWSPALRLLVDTGRRTARRPAAIAAALAARGARVRAYTVWPTVRHPQLVTDVGYPASAVWLRATFEDRRARRFPGAATWSALRTRGLLGGPPSRLVTEALARAGRELGDARLALYSPTGVSNSKAACFVFQSRSAEPALVVKAMPERRFADRLRHETEIVEAIRNRMAGAPGAAALPLRPLLADAVQGDYVVVQAVDPLAAWTGAAFGPEALAWLRGFQAATTLSTVPWSAGDTHAALEPVRYAWERARPQAAPAVTERAEALLRALEAQPVPRCAVHGDFWAGNIAQRGPELRVYDWEWARADGAPFFDLWTSELGVLRERAEKGEAELLSSLRAALARVEDELRRRALDDRFALATLPPSLGELAFRVRRATGVAGGAEAESARLMDATAVLLGANTA